MKRYWIFTLLMTLAGASMGQDGNTVFPFLRLPHSAHAAALGGENITTIADDLTLSFHNPALLCNVSDRTLNLGFTSYIKDSKVASAAFARQFGERSTWAAAIQYLDYGSITETDVNNNELGELPAKDMAFMGTYSYLLSERWSGGVTAKFIQGTYAEYTSSAIGIDLGLNYFHEEKELSASLTIRNLGGQVKTFDEEHEKLPLNMQVGLSKKLAHAPIRLSVTLDDLTHWESSYYNPSGEDAKFKEILFNHVIMGIEIAPSERFYIAAGYNCKRGNELKIDGGSKWTGATLGGGLQLKRVKIGAAYTNYHTAASSLILNFSMGL